jgi:hypothetical protein
MNITAGTGPLSGRTYLHLAQFFISLLASILSQKEHWIGMVSELRRRCVVADCQKELAMCQTGSMLADYISAVGRFRSPPPGIDFGIRFPKV